MTFLFWAAAIVVFAIAEAATTALVSIWFAVGAAAAMVASIFTASLGVQCAVFAVVSAVALAVMLPQRAAQRHSGGAAGPGGAAGVRPWLYQLLGWPADTVIRRSP